MLETVEIHWQEKLTLIQVSHFIHTFFKMDHRLKCKMLNYKKILGKNTGQKFDMCMGQEPLDLTTKQQSIKFS